MLLSFDVFYLSGAVTVPIPFAESLTKYKHQQLHLQIPLYHWKKRLISAFSLSFRIPVAIILPFSAQNIVYQRYID